MKNRVSNGVFGKIVRTLGFILVLISSVLILSEIVLANTSNSILAYAEPYAQLVQDAIAPIGFNFGEYALFAFVVGLLFLVWALRKGLILRLLITVLLVFVFVEAIANQNGLFTGIVLVAPSFVNSAVSLVETYLDQAVSASPYIIPGASLVLVLFLWTLFANKKPKRASVSVVRLASLFLLLAIIVAALPLVASASVFTQSWYVTVQLVLYVLSYALFILGSAFGILGFLRS